MQFSIRLALLAIAYVALASAAFASSSAILPQIMWGVSIVALCYGVLAAFVGNGEKRAMAAGFAISWAAYYWLYLAPGHLPARSIGIDQIGIWSTQYVTINAIATVAAGLIGCGLGVLAYRRSRPSEPRV